MTISVSLACLLLSLVATSRAYTWSSSTPTAPLGSDYAFQYYNTSTNQVSVYACIVPTGIAGSTIFIGSLAFKDSWRCVYQNANKTLSHVGPGKYKVLRSPFGDLATGKSTPQQPIPSGAVTTPFAARPYARPCAFQATLYIDGSQIPLAFYGTADFDAQNNYKCTGASFYLWSPDFKTLTQGAPFYMPVSTA